MYKTSLIKIVVSLPHKFFLNVHRTNMNKEININIHVVVFYKSSYQKFILFDMYNMYKHMKTNLSKHVKCIQNIVNQNALIPAF